MYTRVVLNVWSVCVEVSGCVRVCAFVEVLFPMFQTFLHGEVFVSTSYHVTFSN